MDVVREKIRTHGPIASVKPTEFAVEHVDGHVYVVAVRHELRLSPINHVELLNKADQGIRVTLENGDGHVQFFPGTNGHGTLL